MKRVNLVVGFVSLALGLGILAYVLSQRGLALTVGLLVGGLLVVNAGVVFWMMRARS